MSPSVTIAEDNFSGHRFNYVRILAKGAVEVGWSVHVLAPADCSALHESELLRVGATVEKSSGHSLAELAAVAERNGCDVMVIPDGDRLALSLGSLARWPSRARLRVLVMRQHAQPRASGVQTAAIEYIRRALFAVAGRRPRIEVCFLESALASAAPKPFVPDPIRFAPDAQPPIELEQGVVWVGIVGTIDERKNVPALIEALGDLDGRRFGLVLAGRLDERVKAQLAGASDLPLKVLDRHLTDGELDSVVRALDVVVVAHDNEAPSGILGKAAAAGTRVLAAGAQTLRRDCELIGPGARWVPLRPGSLTIGLERVMADPAPAPRSLSEQPFIDRLILGR